LTITTELQNTRGTSMATCSFFWPARYPSW